MESRTPGYGAFLGRSEFRGARLSREVALLEQSQQGIEPEGLNFH